MSITSATAVYMLSVQSLFPTPQQLQGFSADEVYATDPIDSAEVLMGIDGYMSAGFVFVPIKQNISLQADSASNTIFQVWWESQQLIKDLYIANGTIRLPSIGQKLTMTNGVLTTFPPLADAGKTLKPRKYGITWNSVIPAPI